MQFVNLTQHVVNILIPGQPQLAVPGIDKADIPEIEATYGETENVEFEFPWGEVRRIPVTERTLSKVIRLPEPKEGVILFVGLAICQALPHRTDLRSPIAVRNMKGYTVGLSGLYKNLTRSEWEASADASEFEMFGLV